VGPTALLTVIDGGLRRAQVAQARAEFDTSAANYRGVMDYLNVITAQTALLQAKLQALDLAATCQCRSDTRAGRWLAVVDTDREPGDAGARCCEGGDIDHVDRTRLPGARVRPMLYTW
jgi:hypothetical protein